MSPDVLIPPDVGERRYDVALVARALAADLAAVAVFALIGRLTHDDGVSVGGLAGTAWPFLVGVAGGWAGIFLARLRPLSFAAATMMLVKSLILGTVIRAVIQDEPTPLAFVAVTTLTLGVLFFGWRAASRRLGARRRS